MMLHAKSRLFGSYLNGIRSHIPFDIFVLGILRNETNRPSLKMSWILIVPSLKKMDKNLPVVVSQL